jgi:hypothetical protein
MTVSLLLCTVSKRALFKWEGEPSLDFATRLLLLSSASNNSTRGTIICCTDHINFALPFPVRLMEKCKEMTKAQLDSQVANPTAALILQNPSPRPRNLTVVITCGEQVISSHYIPRLREAIEAFFKRNTAGPILSGCPSRGMLLKNVLVVHLCLNR